MWQGRQKELVSVSRLWRSLGALPWSEPYKHLTRPNSCPRNAAQPGTLRKTKLMAPAAILEFPGSACIIPEPFEQVVLQDLPLRSPCLVARVRNDFDMQRRSQRRSHRSAGAGHLSKTQCDWPKNGANCFSSVASGQASH